MEKRNHFNCIAKINQAEGKSEPATKKNSGQGNRGENAEQQILFFKNRRKNANKNHFKRKNKKRRRGREILSPLCGISHWIFFF